MRTRDFLTAVAVCLLLAGCSHAGSSAHATGRALPPSDAPVTISASAHPAGAEELGVVEAWGRRPGEPLEAILARFRARVAELGGTLGRVDSFATRHELVPMQVDYECGGYETTTQTQTVTSTLPDGSTTMSTVDVPQTTWVSKTCSETRMVEVSTLTLVGRAFRPKGER